MGFGTGARPPAPGVAAAFCNNRGFRGIFPQESSIMALFRCLRAVRAFGITLALGASLLGSAVYAQGSSTPVRILVGFPPGGGTDAVSYTHLRAHETDSYLVCRLL